jgi:hypothetical protein
VSDPSTPKPWLGQRIYNFLFKFLGPAQLGTFDDAEPRPADASYRCPVCGHAMSEHSYTQTADRKRMVCPAPPLGPHA